ncbi:MAG: hypothetical protein J2P49_10500 [Methylocapsa sp.]|nr:hypothetical protein [Methylocapsa sp.]
MSGAAGAVDVFPADGLRNFLAFCRLPRLLYKGHEGFAPPLDADRWGLFSPRLNPHFKSVQSRFWLARRNGKPAGRIFAQIYEEPSAPHNASRAQFGCLDAIDDEEVVAGLTWAAEEWLRCQGASQLQGPFSPSINSESGLLIQGFTEVPMIAVPWHPPYLGALIEAQGYAKVHDLISYRYDVGEKDWKAEPGILARPEWRKRLNIRSVNLRYLKQEAEAIVDIFNDSWSENWGFVPFTLEEFVSTAAAIKLVAPGKGKFMQGGLMIELDGKPQAFALVLPNLHEIMADLDGRLFPSGLLPLVARMRSHPYWSGRVALFGMRRALHRTWAGGVVILAFIAKLRQSLATTPVRQYEFGWVLEDNFGMRRPIELSGGRVYKVHRIYEKRLAGN